MFFPDTIFFCKTPVDSESSAVHTRLNTKLLMFFCRSSAKCIASCPHPVPRSGATGPGKPFSMRPSFANFAGLGYADLCSYPAKAKLLGGPVDPTIHCTMTVPWNIWRCLHYSEPPVKRATLNFSICHPICKSLVANSNLPNPRVISRMAFQVFQQHSYAITCHVHNRTRMTRMSRYCWIIQRQEETLTNIAQETGL